MTDPYPPRGQWTADLLSCLPNDKHLHEVIDGQLHVIYANDYSHSLAVWSLATLIAPFAWSHYFEFHLGPKPLRFSNTLQVQPDLAVLPRWKEHSEHFAEIAPGPELIVEVATPASIEADVSIKQRAYAANNVNTYWVVDYMAREVVVWHGQTWQPRTRTRTLTWRPRRAGWDELTIDLHAYFDGLPDYDTSLTGSAPWVRRLSREFERGEEAPPE
jgi:Uma2 family endonuclease